MSKYLIILFLLVGCTTTQPRFYSCEEEILDVYVDHEYSVMAWVDEDCDGTCDRADFYVINENLVLVFDSSLSCEDATDIVEEYKKQLVGEEHL